ncbi:MAG: PA14 domain-containing protein [Saprospiraceae bacterium]
MHLKTRAFLLAFLCGSVLSLSGQSGLLGEYFNGQNFEQKVYSRTDVRVDFVWDNVSPAPGIGTEDFSVRWTGKIQAPETGTYRFSAHVDDGIRVQVDGQLVINAWGLHDSERMDGRIQLQAGHQYDLVVEYYNGPREGEIQLYWQLPSERPVFQGALGYNDHIIDSRYFFQPASQIASTKPALRVTTPKPVQTPPKKPVTKPNPPAPKPVSKPALIAKDTLEKYLPKNILFVQSKSIMLPESEPELDRLAGFLVRNPQYRLNIAGHTDRVGDSGKNLELSEERAQRVANYLTQKGLAANRITAKGYGDTRPLVREPANKPNAINRRVEFVIEE